MASDKVFKHESLQDTASLLDYLDAIRAGFDSGTLVLGSGNKELRLSPRGLVKFVVEAKSKDGRHKLAVKFSWKDEDDSENGKDPLDIKAE